MPGHSTHDVPENHPLHKVEGERLFNAVFSHLDDDKRAEIRDLMEHERKELRTARGREQILVSIRYTGKGLDFGFREGEPI